MNSSIESGENTTKIVHIFGRFLLVNAALYIGCITLLSVNTIWNYFYKSFNADMLEMCLHLNIGNLKDIAVPLDIFLYIPLSIIASALIVILYYREKEINYCLHFTNLSRLIDIYDCFRGGCCIRCATINIKVG